MLWLCLLFGGGHLLESRGATEMCGTIVNGHWTKANSPYLVTCDILVAGLEIDPGVEVQLQGNYVFEVAGSLKAVGTKDEPIVFGRTNGTWKGLSFNKSSPGSVLQCVVISNANNSALSIIECTPTLRYCELSGNVSAGARSGAGLWVSVSKGELVLEGCTIRGNTAYADGGGVYASVGTGLLRMIDCVVADNVASYKDAGSRNAGGMMVAGDCQLTRCTVAGNVCYAAATGMNPIARGGGLYLQSGAARLENCIIRNNQANSRFWWSGVKKDSYAYGGGVYLNGGTLDAVNSIIADNLSYATGGGAYRYGHGVYMGAGTAHFINCVMAYHAGIALHIGGGRASMLNSIVYFNNGGSAQFSGALDVTYSDVDGVYPGSGHFVGEGNINANPIFLNRTNLMIVPGSPCIDAGSLDPSYEDTCFWGAFSLGTERNDMGAHGGTGACQWPPPAPPLQIVRQPSPYQAVCIPGRAEFCVRARGEPPLSYEWRFHGNAALNPPVELAGATSDCLVIEHATVADAGYYSVRVSSAAGNVVSEPALLVVTPICASVDLYAGVALTGGVVGQGYSILSATNLTAPIAWTFETTVTQTVSGVLWIDTHSPARGQGKYYYATNQISP